MDDYLTNHCQLSYDDKLNEYVLKDKLTNSIYWLKVVDGKIVLQSKTQ